MKLLEREERVAATAARGLLHGGVVEREGRTHEIERELGGERGDFEHGTARRFAELPQPFEANVPAAVFLGKVQGEALWQGLLIEVGWAVVLVLLTRWLYARGLRHYSAYGG